mmetsp:Transcript_966/g.1693  ORF Transcript_966/g.1693 Transcript_966/m.1693 type:complete len:342 (-) Transcript_966:98-1123(-)
MRNPTPRIALIIQAQIHNKVKPIRRQIQHITGMQYHLVHSGILKILRPTLLRSTRTPIHRRMPYGGMSLGIQSHLGALIRIRQYIPPLATQHGNGIATHIKVIGGRDAPHAEPTVDAPFLMRVDDVKFGGFSFGRIKEGELFVDEGAGRHGIGAGGFEVGIESKVVVISSFCFLVIFLLVILLCFIIIVSYWIIMLYSLFLFILIVVVYVVFMQSPFPQFLRLIHQFLVLQRLPIFFQCMFQPFPKRHFHLVIVGSMISRRSLVRTSILATPQSIPHEEGIGTPLGTKFSLVPEYAVEIFRIVLPLSCRLYDLQIVVHDERFLSLAIGQCAIVLCFVVEVA